MGVNIQKTTEEFSKKLESEYLSSMKKEANRLAILSGKNKFYIKEKSEKDIKSKQFCDVGIIKHIIDEYV